MRKSETRINSVPYSVASPSRLAALAHTNLLDSPIEASFERLTSLAARTIHAPVCLVSLVDQERQFFKSAFGLPEPWLSKRETPLSHSFCKHVVATGKPLVIENAKIHPILKTNLAISELNVIAYAGIPLTLSNGANIGSFCVIDHHPRKWKEEEIKLLEDIGASVLAEIELRLLMAAKEELLDVIFHDLKNPLNAIALNSQILKRKISNTNETGLIRSINTIHNGTERMKSIIMDLSDLRDFERGKFFLNLDLCNFEDIINHSLNAVRTITEEKEIQIIRTIDQRIKFHGDRVRLSQALSNLLCFALNRSQKTRTIHFKLRESDKTIFIQIKDEGPEFTLEDQKHFFDRFVETPSCPTKALKLSICLANEIIRAHRGLIHIEKLKECNSIEVELPYNR